MPLIGRGLVCALAAWLVAPTSAHAQDDTADGKAEAVGADADQDQGIAPYGAGFVRKRPVRSQFDLALGGHIKLDLIYDTQQINSDLPFFAVADQRANETGDGLSGDVPDAKTASFNVAARELLLYLAGGTPEFDGWSASTYVEFNFLGFLNQGANAGSPTPILRHGYAVLSHPSTGTSILFGQAEGPFAPLDAQTVNWETLVLIGNPFNRLPQLRLTQLFGGLKVELAAVRPADYINDSRRGYDFVGRGQDSGLPEFNARVSYSFGEATGHYWFFRVPPAIGLSGRYARERFAAGADAEEDFASWTAALDFLLPLGPLTLSGELFYGQNSDNVYTLGGVAGDVIDGSFDPDEAVAEYGGWAQLGWRPTEKLYLSLIYGRLQPDADAFAVPGRRQASGYDFTLNHTITANAYWQVLPSTFIAIEYSRLMTESRVRLEDDTRIADVSGALDRVQLAFLHSF
ncbi:MAG: hypothetical protein H6701_13185 [Myxococcales bacterium]|nr:hypothetical protein [Myxococcales bacterium]